MLDDTAIEEKHNNSNVNLDNENKADESTRFINANSQTNKDASKKTTIDKRIQVALTLTVTVFAFFAIFISFLAALLHFFPQLEWDRYVYLLTGIETITFTAIGWLFGQEVSRGEIKQAEAHIKDIQDQANQNTTNVKEQISNFQEEADKRAESIKSQAELRAEDLKSQAELRVNDSQKLALKAIGEVIQTLSGDDNQNRELINIYRQENSTLRQKLDISEVESAKLRSILASIYTDLMFINREIRQDANAKYYNTYSEEDENARIQERFYLAKKEIERLINLLARLSETMKIPL